VVQAGVPRPPQPMVVPSPQATPSPGQQHWTPGTPTTPQQAGVVAGAVGTPIQTVQTAGIQTPGTQMVQGTNLPQDEAQRQLLFQRQQQLRRLQLLQQQKQAQLQAQAQAGQVVQNQVVQGQIVQNQVVQGQVVQGQVAPGQVPGQGVQGPRMGALPFAPGVMPGTGVPQQVRPC